MTWSYSKYSSGGKLDRFIPKPRIIDVLFLLDPSTRKEFPKQLLIDYNETCSWTMFSIPPISTVTPLQCLPKWGKKVEKTPGNNDVVIDRDKKRIDRHGPTNTWNKFSRSTIRLTFFIYVTFEHSRHLECCCCSSTSKLSEREFKKIERCSNKKINTKVRYEKSSYRHTT